MFRRRIGVIRRAVYSSLQRVRNAYSRMWIIARLRVCFFKVRTWHSALSVKADVASFDLTQLRHRTKEELGHLASMPSLRAVLAPWRLGRWPTRAYIQRHTLGHSRQWALQCNLPSRARGAMTTFWMKFLGEWHLPRPPEEWRAYELVMHGAAQKGRTLVPDDRDPAKAWSVRTEELVCHLLASTLEDEMWMQCPSIQPCGVLQWLHSRAFLGLPGFLRKFVQPTGGRQCSAPLMFGFIKSKCFTDDGVRKCLKAGHSCVRRVLDMSCIPNARGWKTVARAIRGTVAETGLGKEVFALRDIVTKLREKVGALQRAVPAEAWTGGAVCRCCGKPLAPGLKMVAMDIDQAFEACRSSTVLPALSTVSAVYQQMHRGIPIQVKRGRRNVLRHGTRGFSRQWWSVGSEAIVRALLAATTFTLVVLSGMVLQMTGLSIGGVMSSAAVSVRLAAEETLATSALGHEKHMDWLRYVDDMLSMSFVLCCACLVQVLQRVYQEKLSVVHSTDDFAAGTFLSGSICTLRCLPAGCSGQSRIQTGNGFLLLLVHARK